ncbi:MAG: NADH-quinone oxidoreductase subunit C [Ignavibacteriales bacterium]|nr:NADH-quinone oxidoreductase subunit C [Ignavibacteriales bacterium]
MNNLREPLLNKLNEQFSSAIESVNDFRDETTIIIKKDFLISVCTFLRDDNELAFDSLRDVTAVDYSGFLQNPIPHDHDIHVPEKIQQQFDTRFQVVYNLYSMKNHFRIRLKVKLEEDETIPTVSSIWKSANWAERETYDMFGIKFEGHPDLRRMYMPEEFEFHPLRKEFPLMGIPGSLPLPKH